MPVDALEKLRLLGPPTCYEPAEELPLRRPAVPESPDPLRCIYQAVLPGGKRIALLKTLLTSACERDCLYCAFRRGRDAPRASFSPDELARLFIRMHERGLVEGIFLSSGIAGSGPRTEDLLIDTAEILRRRYGFRGYIHLKIMPGAEREQVIAAMRLANRVSVNLEAPNPERLARLCPHKTFYDELFERLRWIAEVRRTLPGRWPSATTQFVVGAAGESDREILLTTQYLLRDLGLARAYFSRFEPIPGTPLEGHPPTPALREHRLYESSFLLRDYGFSVDELPFDRTGNLPLDVNPKLAWARRHLLEAPVEVNTATRGELLRVPGIGPTGAERILRARTQGRLRELGDLRKLGVRAEAAAPFILLAGRRPARQLALWPAEPGAVASDPTPEEGNP
jgi:predicted DNA-binding helix-hairpin-helix protein